MDELNKAAKDFANDVYNICMEKGILVDFFSKNPEEVKEVLQNQFIAETIRDALKEEE